MTTEWLNLPAEPGAYRWYYADVSTPEHSAVFIFMIGSVFSPRYSASLHKGGLPLHHSAVNFALYERGARWLWVLTEYQDAAVLDGRTLRIGASSLSYHEDGRVEVFVSDRTVRRGDVTEAHLVLRPSCPTHPELQLVDGAPHFWRPYMVRARATLSVPTHGVSEQGDGYHDGNWGDEPLGRNPQGWSWTRVHEPDLTRVLYRPWGADRAIALTATDGAVETTTVQPVVEPQARTTWGLKVPTQLGVTGRHLEARPRLLESSPFYARLESREGGAHAMGEVADFQRFHRPYIRWMANFRTRHGTAA